MIKKLYLFTFLSLTFQLSGYAQFDLNSTVRNACAGGSSGAITVTITNNTAASDFTYYWLGPDDFEDTLAISNVGAADLTATRAGLDAGNYRVHVYRNNDNAFDFINATVLQSADPLGFAVDAVTQSSCNPGVEGNGSITVSASDGTGPYLYAIRTNTGVAPIAADFAGLFTANGGVFTALPNGNYDLAVRDAYNCVVIIADVLVPLQASAVTLNLVNATDVNCPGGADGIIEVVAANGLAPYNFAIKEAGGALTEQAFIDAGGYANTTGTFINRNGGGYDLSVRDAEGCVAFLAGVGVDEPDPIVITSEVRFATCDTVSVLNDTDGSVNITSVNGGTAPYTYEWTDPEGDIMAATGTSVTGLTEGLYSVLITDSRGCEAFFNFRIYYGFEIVAIAEDVTCKESDDGRITLAIIWDNLRGVVDHGQPGVNQFVTWTGTDFDGDPIPIFDVDNDNTLEDLGPGIYVARVEDQFGCVKRDTVEVGEPLNPLTMDSTRIVNVVCLGEATGIIEIYASGGTGFFEYSIDGGTAWQQQRLFTGLMAGDFDLVVRDRNGCEATLPVSVEEPVSGFVIDRVDVQNIVCSVDDDNGVATLFLDKTINTHPITRIEWFTGNNINNLNDLILDSVNPDVEDQLDNLGEGIYRVQVTDGFGCVRNQTFEVNRPEDFEFTFTQTNVPCPAPEGGPISITINPSGGTAPYTFQWTKGESEILAETSNVLTRDNTTDNDGEYFVRITDFAGCQIDNEQNRFNITIPDPMQITVVDPVIQNACIGGVEGRIEVTVAGGTPFAGGNYQYSWFKDGDPFASTQNISNLGAGEYRVQVTDFNECTPVIANVTITEPTTTFDIGVDNVKNVTCFGDLDGRIDITMNVEAGHPTNANQFTYRWFKDGNPFPLGNDLQDLIGTASLPVEAGTYLLEVNDNYFGIGNGCVKTETVVIEQFQTITLNPAVTQITCPGDQNASVTVAPNGGNTNISGEYTIEWRKNNVVMGGETGLSITDLEPDSYQVHLTDDEGCLVTQNFVINPIDAFVVTNNITEISCFGQTDGAISLTVSGGTPPYFYNWSRNGNFFSDDPNVNNLNFGVYDILVTDNRGCVAYDEQLIINEPGDYTLSGTVANVTCNGDNNGSISVTVNTSGTQPDPGTYDYTWTRNGDPFPAGDGLILLTNLSPGTYELTVNDNTAGSCEKTISFNVVQFPPITITPVVTQPSCFGELGSATISPNGGQGPYTIEWRKSGTPIPGETGTTIENLESDSYQVRVTDQRGCLRSVNFPINTIQEFTVNESVTQITCLGEADGSIVLTNLTGGTGAYDILWRRNGTNFNANNVTEITGLNPANYEVIITDENDCEVYRETYTINTPTDYTVTPTVNNIRCNGETNGSISVNVTTDPGHPTAPGDFTYTWTFNGAAFAAATTNITNLAVGDYQLTINDNKPGGGCVKVFDFEIIQFAPISLNLTSNPLVCPGVEDGEISISPVGGSTGGSGNYTIRWFRGLDQLAETGTTLSNLGSGLYRVEVQDDQNCVVSQQVEIQDATPFTLTENISPITCEGNNDAAIEIVLTGGEPPFNIQWLRDGTLIASNVTSIENLAPNEYSVTVTDNNGCQIVQENYTISNPTTTFEITGQVTNIRCNGEENGAIDITINTDPGHPNPAGYTYTWEKDGLPYTQGVTDIDDLGVGTYVLTVNDNSLGTTGCEKTATFNVIQFNPIQVNPIATQIICPGDNTGQITVNPTGGNIAISGNYTFQWFRGATLLGETSNTLSNLGPDTYRVRVTDDQNCTREQVVNIAAIPPFQINESVTNVTCIGGNDGRIELSFTGGTPDYTTIWEKDGNFFSSNETIDNLIPGDYDVTVTDANNCEAVQKTITITEPTTTFQISGDVTNIRCNGETNGVIDITITTDPGHPTNPNGYVYTWTKDGVPFPDGNGLRLISGLEVGNYQLQVNDNGCIQTASFNIVEFTPISINPTVENISCPGDNDASITIQPNGGLVTTGYTILWFREGVEEVGETGTTLANIAPGNYEVRVTDNNGCTRTQGVSVPNITPFESSESITQISCLGENDGAVALGFSGGTPPYSVTWRLNGNFFSNDVVINNLAPGDYELSVTDANNCGSVDKTITIDTPTTFFIDGVVKNVTCNGGSDGAIDITLTTEPGHPRSINSFTYEWFRDGQPFPSVQTDIDDLLPGSYELVVNDNGCIKSETFEVVEYPPIAINPVVTPISCAGSEDAQISIQPNGGRISGDYTVRWLRNGVPMPAFDDELVITGLSPASYRVEVTDDQGCMVNATRNIQPKTPMVVDAPTVTNITCKGEEDATIALNVTGGTTPYTFEWTYNGFFFDSPEQNLSNLPAGDYEVTITDANACNSETVPVTISVATGFEIQGVATIVNCNGSDGGTIEIEVIADPGRPNPNTYTYTWFRDNVELPEEAGKRVLTNMTEGDYRVEVRDNTFAGGGCLETAEFTIVAAREILVNPVVTQISCPEAADGRIALDISGGEVSNGYTLRWYKNIDLMADETGLFIEDLAPDFYRVEVEDDEGCMKEFQFTIVDKEPITVAADIIQIECLGDENGSIKANISGGSPPYDIFWRRNGEIFSQVDSIGGLPPGNYELIIEDQSNCPRFQEFFAIDTLTTTYVCSIQVVSPIVCNNESSGELSAVIATDTGHPTGFQVRWFKNEEETPFSTEITVSELEAGDYRVEVTDTLNCVKQASITLTNPDPIDIRANVRELLCHDATNAVIQLDPMGGWGGFTAQWSEVTAGPIDNNTLRLANIGAGEYTLTLSDSVGCSKDTVILISNPLPIVVTPTITNVNCNEGSNGAIDIEINEGTPPYTFEWRRDSVLFSTTQNVSGLVAGNYTVRVRDNNGCILLTDPLVVTEPSVVWSVDAEMKPITCNNDSDAALSPIITLEGGDATFNFNWYKDSVIFAQSTRNISGLLPGNYQLEVRDNFGCVKTSQYTIINPTPLELTENVSNVTCFGAADGRIAIQVTGGYGDYTYRWRRFNQNLPDTTATIESLDVGVYQVDVTDVVGCAITRRFEVTQALPLIVNHTVKHNTCPTNFDSEINVTISGGIAPYRFLWANSAGVPVSNEKDVFGLAPDEYTLVVTDSFFCEVVTQPILVTAPPQMGFNILVFEDNLCPQTSNGTISVQGRGGTGPYTFSFDSSAFASKNDFFGLSRGNYALSLQDSRGCVFDSAIFINNQYELEADFTYSFQELAMDFPITFTDQSIGPGIVSWFWSFGDQRASNQPNTTITYESIGEYIVELTVENEVQCVSTKRDTLHIEKGFVFTIPGGFSPNGDGLNDFFRPVFDNVTGITTRILDRNGQLVFASDERSEFWDGTVDGKRAPQGAYYYEISYVSRAGKRRFEKGKVLLIR